MSVLFPSFQQCLFTVKKTFNKLYRTILHARDAFPKPKTNGWLILLYFWVSDVES